MNTVPVGRASVIIRAAYHPDVFPVRFAQALASSELQVSCTRAICSREGSELVSRIRRFPNVDNGQFSRWSPRSPGVLLASEFVYSHSWLFIYTLGIVFAILKKKNKKKNGVYKDKFVFTYIFSISNRSSGNNCDE